MGEIAHQFRPFCFSISPNLVGNFAQIAVYFTIFSTLFPL